MNFTVNHLPSDIAYAIIKNEIMVAYAIGGGVTMTFSDCVLTVHKILKFRQKQMASAKIVNYSIINRWENVHVISTCFAVKSFL